ncbi:MAG TPA: hypothetical protein VN132_12280, partial [Bdellovibrio sp.]|nr:hypothetical protein [Bdellovibrio sp.]
MFSKKKYTLGALVGMILVAGVIASLLNQPVVHYHPTHKMLFPQANFTVVPLDDNQVLLVGGGVPDKYGEKDKTNRAAQIYNAKEDHFYPAGSMHYQRGGSSWYGFTATHLKDGRVLIVGGQDPVTHEWIKAVELFDPKDRKFHEVPSISLPITAHSSTLLPSGEVLIIDETQGYIFNPKNQQLKKTPPLLIHQQNHSSVLLDKNRVLIVGSYSDYGESPPVAEYYDIQKNMFFKLSDTITGKY